MIARVLAALLLVTAPLPALAWSVVPASQPVAVAKSTMTVTPGRDWNKNGSRPSKRGEMWTLDGVGLNELAFFAAIPPGEPIFRETSKKNRPLPKFEPTMLAPDIIQAYEESTRIQTGSSLFNVGTVEPMTVAGHPGFRATFDYVTGELTRRGELRGAVIDGKLYLMHYVALGIYYFDKDLAEAHAVMDSAKL